MNFLKRSTIQRFLVLAWLAMFWSSLSCPALPAAEPPETLTLPAGPLPDPPEADPATEQSFRHAIRQGANSTTNDPVVDDLLDIMRINGGSILEGSSLDPKQDRTAEAKASQTRPNRLADLTAGSFRTAEQLLKTARLLDKIQPISENRKRLVNQMRLEAVRLLKRTANPDVAAGHPSVQQSTKPSDPAAQTP